MTTAGSYYPSLGVVTIASHCVFVEVFPPRVVHACLIIFRLFIYIFSIDERNTPPHTRKRTTGIGLEPVAPPPKNKRQYDGVVAAAAASSEDDDAANTGIINSNNGPVMKRTEIDDLLRGG